MTASNEMKTLGVLIAGEVPSMPKAKAPKETAAARRIRIEQERILAEAAEEAKFKAEMETRSGQLLKIAAMAYSQGFSTSFKTAADGCISLNVVWAERVRNDTWGHSTYNDETEVSMRSEDWEIGVVFEKFEQIQREKAEVIRMREVARTTYDSMTQEQRDSLGLTHRP